MIKKRLADSAANLQKSAWVCGLCARGGLCLPQTPYAADSAVVRNKSVRPNSYLLNDSKGWGVRSSR